MLYDPKWEPKLDLRKPSLRGLAYLLRHQELWPGGFEWNYGSCDGCAMGLACQLWKLGIPCSQTMKEHFPISWENADRVFLFSRRLCPPGTKVTPGVVADQLDALTETESHGTG